MKHALGLVLLCWTVQATPLRTIDGDTFTANVLIWPGLVAVETVRVLGVDTPERRGTTREAGETARAYTERWLALGSVTLEVCRRDNFGRALARVTRQGEELAEVLVRAGQGVRR